MRDSFRKGGGGWRDNRIHGKIESTADAHGQLPQMLDAHRPLSDDPADGPCASRFLCASALASRRDTMDKIAARILRKFFASGLVLPKSPTASQLSCTVPASDRFPTWTRT